jgi:hypothetical protein
MSLRPGWIIITLLAGLFALTSMAGEPAPIMPGSKELVVDGALTSLQREAIHTLKMQKGLHYGLNLRSPGFFASARLESDRGKVIETFSGFTMLEPPADGVYRITVSCSGGSCGIYTIGVQQLPPPKPPQKLTLPKEGLTLEETLDKTDTLDRVRKRPCKRYEIELTAGKTYVIDMISKKFDAFLRLEDVKGMQLAQDDDSGGGTNARIKFRPKADGAYRIIATSYAGGTGAFTLKVMSGE